MEPPTFCRDKRTDDDVGNTSVTGALMNKSPPFSEKHGRFHRQVATRPGLKDRNHYRPKKEGLPSYYGPVEK